MGIFLLIPIFASSAVNAVTVDPGIVLNTTSSNSSITFSFQASIANITIAPTYIYLTDVTYAENGVSKHCDFINHSIQNDTLDSAEFNCTIVASSSSVTLSGSGRSYYFYEQNKSPEEVVQVGVRIRKGTKKELALTEGFGTGVQKIIMHAKNDVHGEIQIFPLDALPLDCGVSERYEDRKIYKILRIDTAINPEDIENITLIIDVGTSWIHDNNIIGLEGTVCLPIPEELKTGYMGEASGVQTYGFTSNGFSIWVISGRQAEHVAPDADEKDIPKDGKSAGETYVFLENPSADERGAEQSACNGLFGLCLPYLLLVLVLAGGIAYSVFQLTKKGLKNSKSKSQRRPAWRKKFPEQKKPGTADTEGCDAHD